MRQTIISQNCTVHIVNVRLNFLEALLRNIIEKKVKDCTMLEPRKKPYIMPSISFSRTLYVLDYIY